MNTAELLLKYIEVLIWPSIVLFILIRFSREFGRLFDRATKVQLPGGISIETFEAKLQKAKILESEIKAEREPEATDVIQKIPEGESAVNKRMIELGLRPSPSGLDLNYYQNIAKTDIRLAMAGLRVDLELMLRNLAQRSFGKKAANEAIDTLTEKLLRENIIAPKQAEFSKIIFQLTDYAIYGGEITRAQFKEVIRLSNILVDEYILWLDLGLKQQGS